MRVLAEVCEVTPAGAQGSHNVTVHSPLAAVGWPLPAEPPAGAHHDATAYCRAGPVRSRDAGGPVHRPGAADLPAAAAAVRAGDPRVLLPSSRVPVRVLGADAADDRAVRRRHPPLHRRPRPGPGPLRQGPEQGPDRQEQAMVNHWYFYGFDADFGPFYVKFCGYFPFTGQIYINGHEYAMRQCLKAGIAFTATAAVVRCDHGVVSA